MSLVVKTQRAIRGQVTSDKMNKSRVMSVVNRVKNKDTGKVVKRTTKYMFHDEKNESKMGDTVLITAVRPLSARKSFNLQAIIAEAKE